MWRRPRGEERVSDECSLLVCQKIPRNPTARVVAPATRGRALCCLARCEYPKRITICFLKKIAADSTDYWPLGRARALSLKFCVFSFVLFGSQ